jgi:negative regulator of flagellin synthesis FlgM
MVDPIGIKQARDAYVSRAGQAQGAQRLDASRARQQQIQGGGDEDAVELSDGLRSIRHAMDAVRQSPDVRAERVAALRQQIQSGQYNVASSLVAAKMLGRGSGVS